jgi:NTP pyrophosphatase (non-canonical NTP hydrolase)
MSMNASQFWVDDAKKIDRRYLEMIRGKGRLIGDDEVPRFLALAICGEAGELANLIKKEWRGDDIDPGQLRADVEGEIADVAIYLCHLADHLGIDLDVICSRKIAECNRRLDEMGLASPTG